MTKPRSVARPKTEKEARARAVRKLLAIQSYVERQCEAMASFWEEGAVGTELDNLQAAVRDSSAMILSAMDEEIERGDQE